MRQSRLPSSKDLVLLVALGYIKIFSAAPSSALPSVPPSKAQVLGEVDGVKENCGACRPEEELLDP